MVEGGTAEKRGPYNIRKILAGAFGRTDHFRISKMLGTSPGIDPHSFRGVQVVPTGIGMDQRSLPLPVFGGTLGVNDQRIAFWSFENCIGFSCEVIRRFRVGKGKRSAQL